MSSWELYWVLQLNDIKIFMGLAAAVCLLAAVCGAMVWESTHGKIKWPVWAAIPTMIITGLLAGFLPSTQTMALMYVIPQITNNENMQEIPANLAKVANEGLKKLLDQIEDTAKDAEKD